MKIGYSHPTLINKYCTDLTTLAAEGVLDPVIGREEQIEQAMQILCKKSKNNACFVGDSGVGKTVIVNGLAKCIVDATVPDKLKRKKILSIDMDRLNATKYPQVFEDRLETLVDEVKKICAQIILFIDDIHTVIRPKAKLFNSLNVLKRALVRGEIMWIGATTRNEYKEYIESNPTLKRNIQLVEVPEPSIDETVQILRGLRSKYEMHHNVEYADEALIASANLSKEYISDGFLPVKAIDLMDEAGSRFQMHKSKGKVEETGAVVTSEYVKQVISSRNGIPIKNVCQEESIRLLDMVNILSKQIIGQDAAVQAVSQAIRRARVGLRDPTRPIASFFFTGPTGVGKTQVAKLLAQEYFQSKESMVRLDMSEYMERHSVAKLFGSPPGYIDSDKGGLLTEAIRKKPHNLILLDEIEKAHPDVFNALLQILDDGRLTDGRGNIVNFKQTIIIMTSNIGFDSSSYGQDQVILEKDVATKLNKTFRPEFLNRLDQIIIFNKLEKGDLMKVLDIMLEEVLERIKPKNISLEITEKFKEKLLLDSCGGNYSNDYGARPLRRAITRLLEDKLAEKILNGDVKEGDSLIVDIDPNSGQLFTKIKESNKDGEEIDLVMDFLLNISAENHNSD